MGSDLRVVGGRCRAVLAHCRAADGSWIGHRLDAHGADLELRDPRDRIEGVVGDQVGAGVTAPVERHEQRVEAQGLAEPRLEDRGAATRAQPYQLAGGDAELARHLRMDLDERLGLRLDQLRHAPGLRARLVVQQQPAGGQVERILVIRLLGRRPMLDRVEAGTPVRGREAVLKQTRRAGMALLRARPEHAVLGLDPGPGDAGIVGDAAGCSLGAARRTRRRARR